jgi:hypothetical protein
MAITYTKLKSGDWGLRATGENLTSGQRVTVTKANGDSKLETVGKVLWNDNGVTLATIARGSFNGSQATNRSRTSGRRGRRTGCSCGSIEGEYHDWYCASCRFEELDQ